LYEKTVIDLVKEIVAQLSRRKPAFKTLAILELLIRVSLYCPCSLTEWKPLVFYRMVKVFFNVLHATGEVRKNLDVNQRLEN
jgi:hypothetical protein